LGEEFKTEYMGKMDFYLGALDNKGDYLG